MDLGVSFSPTQQSANNNGRGGPAPQNAVQDAIRILSFAMPKVVGGSAPAPAALLNGPGSMGISPAALRFLGLLFPTSGMAAPNSGGSGLGGPGLNGALSRAMGVFAAPGQFTSPVSAVSGTAMGVGAQGNQPPLNIVRPPNPNFAFGQQPPVSAPPSPQPPQVYNPPTAPSASAATSVSDNFGPYGGLARFGGFGRQA